VLVEGIMFVDVYVSAASPNAASVHNVVICLRVFEANHVGPWPPHGRPMAAPWPSQKQLRHLLFFMPCQLCLNKYRYQNGIINLSLNWQQFS